MTVVYKYPLVFNAWQTIKAPIKQIFTVQIQYGTPCLWALVDTEAEDEAFEICMAGTGTKDGYDYEKLNYIATIQCHTLVFHWFYRKKGEKPNAK